MQPELRTTGLHTFDHYFLSFASKYLFWLSTVLHIFLSSSLVAFGFLEHLDPGLLVEIEIIILILTKARKWGWGQGTEWSLEQGWSPCAI